MEETVYQYTADSCRVDRDKFIEQPPIAISVGDYEDYDGTTYPIPLATYGNFVFIQAPPKHSKTFFVSLLVAAYLGGKKEYVGDMKGCGNGYPVFHVDTEQSEWHAQKTFRRVGKMLTNPDYMDRYDTYSMREYSYRDRLEFIEMHVERTKPGLVVIDGVADLVRDVNDISESSELVQRLMTMSTLHRCAVITVIHQNFGTEKPTGHLGSFLEKKTESQIRIDKGTLENKWLTAKCMRSRNLSFDDIHFWIDNGVPKVMPKVRD